MRDPFTTILDEPHAGSRPRAFHRRLYHGDGARPSVAEDPIVFIVDAERRSREALQQLLESVSIKSLAFGSVDDLLVRGLPDKPSCLVLDVRLPGIGGLTFQEQLIRSAIEIPIVFLTGHADIQMTVRAMKAGAVDFLTKPVRDQDVLDAVTVALQRDLRRRSRLHALAELRERLSQLSEREREVMPMIAAGRMNKQVAAALHISESTVKIYRGGVMRKMRARTVPDLVRMADTLAITIDRPIDRDW
ncbi:response regulator transcription factor [Devosia insulae]|uniref:response regulator transcription factor n=1 Tax=Devosia insulae TaxID=408174 RepID=UPI0009FEB966|nr:response regulator [Devosia insulae]